MVAQKIREATLTGVVDPHLHFRKQRRELLALSVPASTRYCSAVLPMPNTNPPIVTGEDWHVYRNEISIYAEPGCILMGCIKLIEGVTTPETIHAAAKMGVMAAKAYPIGATTGSETGIANFSAMYDVFKAMEEVDMVLCVHGETPHDFVLDREKNFLGILVDIVRNFPRLRIVLEHISTEAAVQLVEKLPETVAATITAHHLWGTLDDVIGGLLNPHAFCKPVLKLPSDRHALRRVAMSASPKFFFGSDSAPHYLGDKECGHGCAGTFTAPIALPMLAQVFQIENGREHVRQLQHFACDGARGFYRLPPSKKEISLVRETNRVPKAYQVEGTPAHKHLVPFLANTDLEWQYAA